MSTAREEVESLLSKLPDHCSLEDIQYHLYVLERVRHGLEVADNQGTLTQEEVERQLSKWRILPAMSMQLNPMHLKSVTATTLLLLAIGNVARAQKRGLNEAEAIIFAERF